MITASSLIALVEARGAKEATAQLLEVGAASDTAGEKIKSMAVGGLLVAGAAAIGFGVASVKMAGNFEQSTNLLITSAGEVPKNIDMIRKGLLQMSVDTATSTDQLVKGMFNIESAGYHGAEALKVEKAAAEGAKVENADLAATTDVLTTAMHNYHEPASQAVDVMNSFRMSASMGKMHMDDLTGALKNVLPIASQAGVALTDVEAALSTMSLAGDKGASAGTHLSQMLTYLLAPSSKATKALKEVGLTTQEISDEMKVSLPGAVDMITQAVGEKFPVGSAKYIAALSAIVGGNKSMKAMLELSGISLKTFTDDAKQLGPTMTANSTAVDGWTTVQSNFNFKMEAAKNAVEALMISVGTKLLPVVGQLADAVTPLIQDFSRWVGSLDQVAAAFQQASQPIKQVQEYLAPLPDTFDRATGAIHVVSNALHPLADTFDHAKAVIGSTTVATKPLLDTFDRATVVIPKVTTFIDKTKEAVSPLVAIFKEWKPILEDVAKTLGILAGDIETFAVGIGTAADKSGVFQSALQFVHDILPDVDKFLVSVGSSINQYLLPPLESLITNVGQVVSDFVSWANTSGTAKSAIADLGTAVGITAQVVGTLVQGVADLVKWFDQDAPQAYILAGAVTALGLAFAGLKVANTVAGLVSMFNTWNEGAGIVANFASAIRDKAATAIDNFTTKQFPNLKNSMDGVTSSANAAAEAEVRVGTATSGKASSQAWFADLEGSLGGVENKANAAAVAEETVGTTAETKMAGGVAVGSAESEASLGGIKVAAAEAVVAEETIGTTAETKMAGGVATGSAASKSSLGGLGGMLGGLIVAIALMGNEWAYSAASGKSFFDQVSRGDWLGALGNFVALGTPGGQLAKTIDVFNQIPGKFRDITGTSQDMSKKVSSSADSMSKNVVASMTDMQKQSIAQGAQLTTGLQNLFQTLQDNANGAFGQMSADAYAYLQNVENYVNQAQNDAARHKLGAGGTNIYNKNFASGTDYAPGGPALVGEAGAELVLGPTFGNLPAGSRVIPNNQLGNVLGGGGNNQPIHVHVEVGGHEVLSYLIDHMGNAMMQQSILQYGGRRW